MAGRKRSTFGSDGMVGRVVSRLGGGPRSKDPLLQAFIDQNIDPREWAERTLSECNVDHNTHPDRAVLALRKKEPALSRALAQRLILALDPDSTDKLR